MLLEAIFTGTTMFHLHNYAHGKLVMLSHILPIYEPYCLCSPGDICSSLLLKCGFS